MQKKMVPIILSGGSGTRLWPISRAKFPKQFCELLDESLLQKSLKRVLNLGSPWVLTLSQLQTLTARVYSELKLPASQMIFEPRGRNTAPAIALLCRLLELKGQANEIVGVFPADHLVLKEKEFYQLMNLAHEAAEKNLIVTLGIVPTYPATGFGYIEVGVLKSGGAETTEVQVVKAFREKPNFETAQNFLKQGTFFWNAGIFVFKASRMIQAFKQLTPQLWTEIQKISADLSNIEEVYNSIDSISIDYAIMEKLRGDLVCLPADIGWSDLGSWDDVSNLEDSVVTTANKARVLKEKSQDCFAFSTGSKVFGFVDVQNLIVVDTPDATLISRKGSTQDVRQIVDQLNALRDSSALEHAFEKRPWGQYAILREESHYKSKLITVDPGAQISYQYHHKRNEHWIIVSGHGEVTLNEKVHPVSPGESVFIPAGMKHRIHNTSAQPLEFVEVQTGTYFGEDDIIRLKDDYSRK
jgi:mannose-1-phosphate guanylyltransferase/mannose-1-phosphate guanylyltransferase/mannose-6-phosphate isomerase